MDPLLGRFICYTHAMTTRRRFLKSFAAAVVPLGLAFGWTGVEAEANHAIYSVIPVTLGGRGDIEIRPGLDGEASRWIAPRAPLGKLDRTTLSS